jgi:hypothetical protein
MRAVALSSDGNSEGCDRIHALFRSVVQQPARRDKLTNSRGGEMLVRSTVNLLLWSAVVTSCLGRSGIPPRPTATALSLNAHRALAAAPCEGLATAVQTPFRACTPAEPRRASLNAL